MWSEPKAWVHGDLHSANILCHDGRISAVIDFGDLNAGDPATDLAVAWMMFAEPERRRMRARYDLSSRIKDLAALWQRAEGWALVLSLAFLANSADNPLIFGIGQRTLEAVLESPRDR